MFLKKFYQTYLGKMLPSLKSFHFQYAAREMRKGALNNYSMLKLRFFNQHPHFFNVL